MSRLDDLKAKRSQLQTAYVAKQKMVKKAEQMYGHVDRTSTTDPVNVVLEKLDKMEKYVVNELKTVEQAIAEEERKTAAKPSSQTRPSSIPHKTHYSDDEYYRRRREDDDRFLAERDRRERRERAHERWHRDGPPHGPDCPYGGRY